MKKQNSANEKLMHIGFTQLEADIYLCLLTKGPQTGYGVAKGIGKAIANVYKAIDNLSKKGIVEQSSGDNKRCMAVDWEQMIASETKKFSANMTSLEQSLKQLPVQQKDEQVYQIKNASHVKEQSLHMVNNAKHIVLAVVEPQIIEWLKPAFIDAAKRGVEVRVKVFEEIEMPGVIVVLRQDGKQVYAKTEDVHFSICADGNEMLDVLLTTDCNNVIQAFRSKSALMTIMLYNQLLYELVLTELKEVIPKGDIKAAQQILLDTEHLHPFSNENKVFDNFKHRYKFYR